MGGLNLRQGRDVSSATKSISALNTDNRAGRDLIVDALRGVAVAFMALDHTRDFFTGAKFEPEDLAHTFPALFFTRWVTHFCAPTFFLLGGVGAYFFFRKTQSRLAVSRFLLGRAILLITLEFSLVGFAWTFIPGWGMGGVLWCLGVSMAVLAALLWLPRWLIAVGSSLTIVFHDMFDTVHISGNLRWTWLILHHQGTIATNGIPGGFFILYPFIPWFAVMALGYCVGPLFTQTRVHRCRILGMVGIGCIATFLVLRISNSYGNAPSGLGLGSGDYVVQSTVAMSIVSFLNVEKYPPSLDYLLMTLGGALVTFALLDSIEPSISQRLLSPFITFGRVPLFFYISHLYVIHGAALISATVSGQPFRWLLHGAFFLNETPKGYGYGLTSVYVAWLLVLGLLHMPCRWYNRQKVLKQFPLFRYV